MAEHGNLDAAGRLVRRYDRDRYLASLFAPTAERQALFALYAFNVEVAKTREVVREPMLGGIRLQWWREAIEEIYAGRPPRQHEVILPLAQAIRRHGLPAEAFYRLLDAREQDLEAEPPADLVALRAYAEGTSSSLVGLALTVLGAGEAAALEIARQVGIAYALVGLLRAVPFHARAQRLYLPRVMLEEFSVNTQQLFDLKPSNGLPELTRRLAEEARSLLAEARAQHRAIPRAAVPALLPAVATDLYLRRLARVGHDVFHPSLAESPPSALWRMGWRALRGRF
ncbi:MAG: squalene/phytoene synthase family protein [Proteobacteria bacterium]|nr:squalene/phytoene synthase family protein [Pseudomonadota bacterium]MBI3498878.1 squalene/phytoene synthase family protein [Pseudomonadota bacterium]